MRWWDDNVGDHNDVNEIVEEYNDDDNNEDDDDNDDDDDNREDDDDDANWRIAIRMRTIEVWWWKKEGDHDKYDGNATGEG